MEDFLEQLLKIIWNSLPTYAKIAVVLHPTIWLLLFLSSDHEGKIALGMAGLVLLPIFLIALISSVGDSAKKNNTRRFK